MAMIVQGQTPNAGPGAGVGLGPAFLDPLELEYLDGRTWKVTQAFDYMSELLGRVIVIPAGFVTDFASIPRPLWIWLPPTGQYGKAAVIHDFLYRNRGQGSRRQADDTLLEAMKVLGVGVVTRSVIYAGVRAGGSGSYKGDDIELRVDASGHALR